MEDAALCVVCHDALPSAALLPCAHASFCDTCATAWLRRAPRCPLCRARVHSVALGTRGDGRAAAVLRVESRETAPPPPPPPRRSPRHPPPARGASAPFTPLATRRAILHGAWRRVATPARGPRDAPAPAPAVAAARARAWAERDLQALGIEDDVVALVVDTLLQRCSGGRPRRRDTTLNDAAAVATLAPLLGCAAVAATFWGELRAFAGSGLPAGAYERRVRYRRAAAPRAQTTLPPRPRPPAPDVAGRGASGRQQRE